MIDVLVCDQNERELALITRDCRELVARFGDHDLRLDEIRNDQGLTDVAKQERLVDLLYYEFQKGRPAAGLQSFREAYGDALVMLIADAGVSPLEYLRPGIAPDSLLLRPVTPENLRAVNTEFLDFFFERYREDKTESSFVVDTREEKIFIPYSHIYYFEARDKKLFVRIKDAEYAFYDTLDELESKLPAQFKRCHRSYIVNTAKILRFIPKDSYIELSDRLGIPISRRYRAEFKGAQR